MSGNPYQSPPGEPTQGPRPTPSQITVLVLLGLSALLALAGAALRVLLTTS